MRDTGGSVSEFVVEFFKADSVTLLSELLNDVSETNVSANYYEIRSIAPTF